MGSGLIWVLIFFFSFWACGYGYVILVVVEGGGDGFQVVVVGCEVGGCCG